MVMWKRGGIAVAVVGTTLILGCTSAADDEGASPDHGRGGHQDGEQSAQAGEPAQAETALPGDEVLVVSADTAGERAARTSAELFSHAPVVLLAAEDDLTAQAAAAPVAVGLGVPLLLTPGSGGDDGAQPSPGAGSGDGSEADWETEIQRLAPQAVLYFGESASSWAGELDGVAVSQAPQDPGELSVVTGVALGEPAEVADDAVVTAVADLHPDALPALAVSPESGRQAAGGDGADVSSGDVPGDASGVASETGAALPPVAPGDPLDILTVLTDPAAENVAAVATARASGARVLVTAETDPRADPDVIAALAEGAAGEQTLALGEAFGPPDMLRSRLAVASTGVELPGGGQVLFPHRRFVALYGTPRSPAMGALGEQPLEEAIERAQETAAEYEDVTDEPVVPALEIITTIAHTEPGPEGDYSSRTPVTEVRPWVDAAAAAGMYVVLDLQPGRADFLSQAQEYEELLLEPHVGLALDPEWRLAPDQRHLNQIGSVDAAEVNEVAEWLAELTAEHQLPQKLLILHQFTLAMITDRADVETGHDELAVLIHADGFGTPQLKFETWDRLHIDAPEGVWWGWKNFIDEDQPMFTPAQTMDIEPAPWFVSYQ
jgi:hypothetical protein